MIPADIIARAKAVPIERVINERGIKLRGKIEREGACPVCGGTDRFAVNIHKQIFNCRGCAKGGDVIALVQHLDGASFADACQTLAGEQPRNDAGKNGASSKLVATFDYHDAAGELAFQVLRYSPKTFSQQRPNGNGGWSKRGGPPLPYRLPQLIEAVAGGHTIFVVEGEGKVDALTRWNVPATCNAQGAKKWKPEHSEYLRGADVIILPDNDAPGRDHANVVGAALQGIAASVRLLELPGLGPKGDVIDWMKGGGTAEQLWQLVETQAKPCARYEESSSPAQPQAIQTLISRDQNDRGHRFEPWSIDRVLKVFQSWLILHDTTPIYAVLGTVAANLLPGDPVWLGLIGPPSSAKTEILNSTLMLPHVVQAATLTPAGCLSGTPKKQHDKTAKGGLLRQIGDFGIIVLKDFGSILSMRPDAKAEVLAALREIYDGA